jgi:hypothetical protein
MSGWGSCWRARPRVGPPEPAEWLKEYYPDGAMEQEVSRIRRESSEHDRQVIDGSNPAATGCLTSA